MTEVEKNNIINNFENYIIECEKEEFLIHLINLPDLSNIIINNNLLWKSIDAILLKFGSDYAFEIFKLLCARDIDKKILNQDIFHLIDSKFLLVADYKRIFDFIIQKNMIDENKLIELIEYALNNKCSLINFGFIVFMLNNNYKNIVKNNFDIILKKCNNLFALKVVIKNNEFLLESFSNYVDANPDRLIINMLEEGFQKEFNEIKELLEKEKIFDMTKIILFEILKNEKLNYSDIEFLDAGEFNQVYSIGSKIFKIGKERDNFKIDNNKRFLKPILRTQLTINNEILGCMEITEKVDTSNITEEDAQFIYNELRESGYIWCDCRPNNLGRLLKRNEIYFENLNPVMSEVNYKTDCKEVLEPGELVIIDNDYIYLYEEFKKMPESEQKNLLWSVEKYELEYQTKKTK